MDERNKNAHVDKSAAGETAPAKGREECIKPAWLNQPLRHNNPPSDFSSSASDAEADVNHEWCVIHAGKELGPFSRAALVEKVVAGEIGPDDLIKETGGLWTKARACEILQQHFVLKNPGAPPSQRIVAPVSHAGTVIFCLGIFVFLLAHGHELGQNPKGFLGRVFVWGLFFAAPACVALWLRQRVSGIATLFLLAASFDAAVGLYFRHVTRPRLNAQLQRQVLHQEAAKVDNALAPAEPIGYPSKDAQPSYNRACAWMDKKNYELAIREFDEAIRLDPNSAIAYCDRGAAWSAKQDYAEASRDYAEAIRLDPNNALYHLFLGQAQTNLAFDKASSAASLGERHAVFRNSRYGRLALLSLKEARRLNPGSAQTYESLSFYHRSAGQWDEALQSADKLVKLRPQSANAYLDRGDCYRGLGKFDFALVDYKESLELDVSNPETHFAIAGELMALQNYEKAIDSYRLALVLQYRVPGACYINIGNALEKSRQYQEALRAYEQARIHGWPGDLCDERISNCRRLMR